MQDKDSEISLLSKFAIASYTVQNSDVVHCSKYLMDHKCFAVFVIDDSARIPTLRVIYSQPTKTTTFDLICHFLWRIEVLMAQVLIQYQSSQWLWASVCKTDFFVKLAIFRVVEKHKHFHLNQDDHFVSDTKGDTFKGLLWTWVCEIL